MQKQLLSALAVIVLALACAGEAGAAVQRTFVSGLGSDTNDCSRAAPCRTFAAAILQTLPGGEVVALDTAGYGPVVIDKAISLISPPGIYAGITTTTGGATGIFVTAGPNDVVVLRGLSLSGLGLGEVGISFYSGRALRVEGLTISGFSNTGLYFFPYLSSAGLTVSDSLIRDNGGMGIDVVSAPGFLARISIERTRTIGNAFHGVLAGPNTRVTVRDTVSTANFNYGFATEPDSVLSLENCISTHNAYGVAAIGGLVRVAGTTVTENSVGIHADPGGSIFSRGNNTVEGNVVDGTFTGIFAAK